MVNLQEWKRRNKKSRNYAHFDRRVSLDTVWNYISDPRAVAKHGFYPFIHYTLAYTRYNRDIGKKAKHREISYSAHIDRFIFQYYGYRLNQYYNGRIQQDKIHDVAIAYRDNLHKNNIHFAKEAIDFIKNTNNCYVLIGDFTDFFDSLDHDYLKNMLCNLLNVERLPEDYYAVFKNITRYSTWDLSDLLTLNGLKNDAKGVKAFKELDVALSLSDFKRLKKTYVNPHRENYGIPQGSAISAVLSNIYMLEFDQKINEYVTKKQGLYMRYSDDFIVVLPATGLETFKTDYGYIKSVIDCVPRLKLEPVKTQIFKYRGSELRNCNENVLVDVNNGKDIMNYLGFSFDGKVVSLRDKTVSKYYYRLYRKLKTIVKRQGVTKRGKRISCKNVYLKYSIKGVSLDNGNFITYVRRAEAVFKGEKAIGQIRRRHMQKIRRMLNQI